MHSCFQHNGLLLIIGKYCFCQKCTRLWKLSNWLSISKNKDLFALQLAKGFDVDDTWDISQEKVNASFLSVVVSSWKRGNPHLLNRAMGAFRNFFHLKLFIRQKYFSASIAEAEQPSSTSIDFSLRSRLLLPLHISGSRSGFWIFSRAALLQSNNHQGGLYDKVIHYCK